MYIVTFFVALLSSLLSGVASGGGGFVMAPYWLLSGMTPAQGATTGSFMALGMTASSLAAFKGTGHYPKDRRLVVILSIVTLIGSVIGFLVLPKIDVSSYRVGLALLTIVSLPLLFIKVSDTHKILRHRSIGYIVSSILLIIGSIITSSTFSILLAISLMTFFKMSLFEMTALRRLLGITQSVVLFIGLAAQGNFIWPHAILALLGGVIGSYVGTKYAVKKGEAFAKYTLAAVSLLSAIALLL
jgi:uncharacterized membrane protein YfcA